MSVSGAIRVLELAAHLAAHRGEVEELVDRGIAPDDADQDDHVADRLTALDALEHVRPLRRRSTAARRESGRRPTGRSLHSSLPARLGRRTELVRRLARHDRQLLLRGQVLNVFALHRRVERADAHHGGFERLAIRCHHLGLEARDVPALGHLSLQLEPEPFEVDVDGSALAPASFATKSSRSGYWALMIELMHD